MKSFELMKSFLGDTVPIWPERASNFALEMDLLYLLLVGLTVFFSVIVFGTITFFVIKYRKGSKADRSNPPHGNLKLEIAWSVIPLLMGVPVFLWATSLYVYMYSDVDDKDALPIFVVGKQWMWHMQHPTGQRENNELHIPINTTIKLTMISQDVIHAFSVPAFRIKHDAVPGRYNSIWFRATKPGRYHLFCAEYCGTEHSRMIGWVVAMEPADYEKWLQETKWGIGNMVPAPTMAEAGEGLFNSFQCVSCHEPGRSEIYVPLTGIYGSERKLDDGRTVIANDDYIRRSILEPDAQVVAGYSPSMPPYKGVLNEQEILQLIAYIKSLKLQPRVAITEDEIAGEVIRTETRNANSANGNSEESR